MNKINWTFLVTAILLLAGHIVVANVKIASVFSDNMVLQADRKLTVWGTANPAESITVEINGNTAATRTGFNKKWKLELPPMKYGGPYELNVFGDDTLTLKNVMIGEVWLCGGQSNMRMKVERVEDAREEIDKANYPDIRFFTAPDSGSEKPQSSMVASWEVCSSRSVGSKTATGYFFGRKLHRELNVAIGLVDISEGAATIFTFMDKTTFNNTLDAAEVIQRGKWGWERYQSQIEEWEADGKKKPRPIFRHQHYPILCYNAMVNPVVPFANRGAIWYQGEANASFPDAYVSWFGDYITMIRNKFNNPEMPFYFVQLAGFEGLKNYHIDPDSWAAFRLGQEKCLEHPNTGMATAMDIGMKNDIHPKNKQEVGRRLALCALNQTYGKTDVVCNGPQLQSIEAKNKSIVLTFSHCHGGLQNKGEGKNVKGFSAILNNGDIVELEGKIKSQNTIEIKASDVQRLRYAYANFPNCPLYNGEGLPALSFDEKIPFERL